MKSSPKDVFTHLLAIITLYISAGSFGALLFHFIDRWFPDPLVDQFIRSSSGIRWAVSSLVIVFPVYIWLSWWLARDIQENRAKRELKIRKWLLYFTLFAAAVVIVGDLVALIYNFLGGDLSARFVLKVATILFIAGVVFGYYLWGLRSERMASRDPRVRWFVFATITVVVVSTVAGFFIIGSPFRERLRRFDERRVQDLQTIQWQIINYWQKKDELPSTLDMLRDDISGFVPPRDPESGTAYEYRAITDLQFEFCAVFKTPSAERIESETGRLYKPVPAIRAGDGMSDNWAHGEGRVCFERTIDPDLYRVPDQVKRP